MVIDASPGLTVREVAKRYRVSPDKIRGWIRAGKLQAINTAGDRASKPRFVILASHLAAFEQGVQATTASKPPARRKRKSTFVDYYPD